ncbi:MAG: hypothetical protein R3A46_00595 [Thermomicrobiales bacterium]
MYRTLRFSICGIEIRATVSWALVALALAGISVWLAIPRYFDGDTLAQQSLLLFLILSGLFASLSVHELAHIFVARRSGCDLVALSPQLAGSLPDTLFEACDPGSEVRVGIAGPAVSWLLAGVAGAVWWLTIDQIPADLTRIFGLFAMVNLGLAVVGLMPGYPFDGGRIARGLFWYLGGDLMNATKIVGYIGYVLIMGAMTVGVFLLVEGGVTAVWGVWILLTAYMINRSVGTGISHVFWSETSRRLRVDDLYVGGTRRIQADVPIDDAIERMLEGHEEGPLLVFQDGQAVGLVDLGSIRPIPRRLWTEKAIGDVMAPIDQLRSTTTSSSLSTLVALLPPDQDAIALITRDGVVIGAADRRDVVRRLQNYLAAERVERMRRGR